jgi:hypothetical protein
MDADIEKTTIHSLRVLLDRESVQEKIILEEGEVYNGLLNIDVYIALITTKFSICLGYLDRISQERDIKEGEKMKAEAGQRAREGLQMLEFMSSVNISEDQKTAITETPDYKEAKKLFHHILLRGGASFFEQKALSKKHSHLLAKSVTEAIAKFAAPDDNYQPLFKTEELTPFWRRIVNTFFFVLAPEGRKDPPYGISEGEEQLYHSEKIKLPLSQAIFYYKNEVLPMLQEMLDKSPGDSTLQQGIDEVRERLGYLESISVSPRSKPLVLPKDYYTEGFLEYDSQGELLVPVALPVTFKSRTNLDRMQELVKFEIARKLAGKGVSPELDKEYYYLRSLKSGSKGDSFFPGLRLRTDRAFGFLKNRYPLLAQLENKQEFKRLVAQVEAVGRKKTERDFERRLLSAGTNPPEIED